MKLSKMKLKLPKLPEPGDHTFFGRLKNIAVTNSHVICAFLVPLILYWAMYIFIGTYPFGENSVLVLDLNGQYVYFFEALRNALHGDGSLIYSWSRTLGGEFIGIYAYYLASPFSYLVYFFSYDHITEALLLIILLKCGISGGTMAYYLRKKSSTVKDLWIILFSTMYALSSYAIAYGHNTMWMDAFMLFPLVIYGVERLIEKQKCNLLIFTLTLTVMSTFYIGYMVCIFVFFYFFYYYFTHSADHANNYYGEKLHFVKSLIRIGVSAVISLAISAVILLPTYYGLTFGKTTFSDPSWEMTSQFNLIEFFAKMLPGSYDTVRPEGLPFVYCGVLTLILLPLYFISKKVKLSEKVGGALMLCFLVICMENSISDLIWHCFQRPNWLNYRYSFMFIFLMIVFACRGAEELEDMPKTNLAWIGGGLIGLIVLLQTQNLEFVDTFICIWLSILFIIAHLSSLAAYMTDRWKKVGTVVLSVFVCVEAVGAGLLNIAFLDQDVVISTRTSYVDFMNRFKGIVDDVQDSDQSFYRMEKTVDRNVCDNMALSIRGIANSTSTLNASAIRVLSDLGYSASSHWSEYAGGNPVSDSLIGMKYIIYQGSDPIPGIYDLYREDSPNDLYAYHNPYALSLAYAVSNDIRDFELYNYNLPNYLCRFEALNEIVTAMLGSEEKVELFKPLIYTTTKNNVETEIANAVKELKDEEGNVLTDENGNKKTVSTSYYFYSRNGSNGTIDYTFTLPEDVSENSSVYFYFPTEYARAIDWSFSGGDISRSGSLFGSNGDYITSVGNLSHDTEYQLTVTLTADDGMFYVMKEPSVLYYLDEAVLEEVFTQLAEGNFVIDEDYSESHFTGMIDVPENCGTVFTSIPYDEGWNIYVDGEKVEPIETLDALLAFEINPGNHKLELRYCSSYMVTGLVISIVGLAVGILLFWLDRRFLRPKLPAKRRAFEKRLEKEEAIRLEKEALERARLAAEAEKAAAQTDEANSEK